MADKSIEAKRELDDFFASLNELGKWYIRYTSEAPKTLAINPDIVKKMAQVEGFYQREELQGLVPAHAPVVRYFKLDFGMVMLVDDWEEKFLHFES
jgi:hypothetical protein